MNSNIYKFKNSHTAPKMEDIELNQEMAFTFNPVSEADPERPTLQFISVIYKKLFDLAKAGGFNWLLYPEASQIGRIHFHGYIRITDIHKWIRAVVVLKDIGTFAIKKTFDLPTEDEENEVKESGKEKWDKYCKKQKAIFYPLFERNILSYPLSCGWDNDPSDEDKDDSDVEQKPLPIKKDVKPRTKITVKKYT